MYKRYQFRSINGIEWTKWFPCRDSARPEFQPGATGKFKLRYEYLENPPEEDILIKESKQ